MEKCDENETCWDVEECWDDKDTEEWIVDDDELDAGFATDGATEPFVEDVWDPPWKIDNTVVRFPNPGEKMRTSKCN